MKICPRCQKSYPDDNLNFCLEDGMILEMVPPNAPDTIEINQVRMTSPRQPSQHAGSPAQPSWGAPQPHAVQPRRSSKAWVWVLLILGGLILLCGGGFLGFLAFLGSQTNNLADQNAAYNSAAPANRRDPVNSSLGSRKDVTAVDLEIFVKESSFGMTALEEDELTMSSKKKGFYYVLVAPEDYRTAEADTTVTLRNVDDANTSLGYGLIFHSNPKPLQKGYAFLVDTRRKRYRVVNHTPGKESSIITWTNSDSILQGKAENTIEVRDVNDKVDLYINGTFVNSIRDVDGDAKGVVGLYAGDGVKVAFKQLEIRK